MERTEIENRVPKTIFFFPNNTAAVCDQYGRQMPKYQDGDHAKTIEILKNDGIDWRTIPEVNGRPRSVGKADLVEAIREAIRDQRLDNATVAQILVLDWPHVEAMLAGRVDCFRMDQLARFLDLLSKSA